MNTTEIFDINPHCVFTFGILEHYHNMVVSKNMTSLRKGVKHMDFIIMLIVQIWPGTKIKGFHAMWLDLQELYL